VPAALFYDLTDLLPDADTLWHNIQVVLARATVARGCLSGSPSLITGRLWRATWSSACVVQEVQFGDRLDALKYKCRLARGNADM
jgi:hypothetical protein